MGVLTLVASVLPGLVVLPRAEWSVGVAACEPTHRIRVPCRCQQPDDDDVMPPDSSESALARPANKYFDAISNISAPELITGFAETAPPEVQQAVRQTVMQLLGNLPPQLYDTSIASTGQNVASLMYSMQMTGYMFRNAEYRRSLMQSLGGDGVEASPLLGGADETLPQVKGKIKVKLSEALETQVEASAYMAELRAEVASLRRELVEARESTQEAQGGSLLSYIQGLGRENIKGLTTSISQEVLDAMKQLIESILQDAGVGGDTFMETSGMKLRELLVWQLVTGYKLREMEKRDELAKLLSGGDDGGDDAAL